MMQTQIRSKVEYLSELLEKLEQTNDSKAEDSLLLQISVIGAYIKRRNNLSFISEDRRQFPARELKNCIEQSLDCLTLFGINAEQDFRLKEDMPMENMVRLYDVFEEAIEYSLDTLSRAVSIRDKKRKRRCYDALALYRNGTVLALYGGAYSSRRR